MREVLRALPENSFHSCVTDPPYHLTSVVKRFGKEGSAPAKHGTDGAFARASAGFMGKCYHPDTEVLGSTGWVRIGDLKVGDLAASLDLATSRISYQPVIQTHCYPFSGSLVHVKHRSAEQVVTPNHNLVASPAKSWQPAFMTASSLGSSFHLWNQGTWVGEGGGRIDVAGSSWDACAFLRFFGLWLGDGYTCNRKNDHPSNDFFGFSVCKPRKVAAIRSALDEIGIKYTETKGVDGKTAFYCYDFPLLAWLKQFGKAANKFIPSDFLRLPALPLEYLYQGLMETDGCRQGRDQHVYYTVSKRLADDFQTLCLHTGRSAINVVKPPIEEVLFPGGHVSPSAESYSLCVLQPGKRLYAELEANVLPYPYEGQVDCVTLAENHTLYTRWNGKPVWSGNSWDGGDIAFDPATWSEVYRVLRPGAYLAAFGGTRTFHRMAVAIEDAGFEIRDTVMWLYGTGFPKSHSVCKEIDKKLGAAGSYGDPKSAAHAGWISRGAMRGDGSENEEGWQRPWMGDPEQVENAARRYIPATPEAAAWDGYGSALKPGWEPIIIARKPLDGTLADNALNHGCGLMNIDGCRVGYEDTPNPATNPLYRVNNGYATKVGSDSASVSFSIKPNGGAVTANSLGRWPANVAHDGSDEVLAAFPEAAGQLATVGPKNGDRPSVNTYGDYGPRPLSIPRIESEKSAARFFYSSKASKADRQGTTHPTTKPLALMQWITRLVTPAGGSVLDPFAGSGSTGTACIREGFVATLVEREAEYVEMIRTRISAELGPEVVRSADDELADMLLMAELEALVA